MLAGLGDVLLAAGDLPRVPPHVLGLERSELGRGVAGLGQVLGARVHVGVVAQCNGHRTGVAVHHLLNARPVAAGLTGLAGSGAVLDRGHRGSLLDAVCEVDLAGAPASLAGRQIEVLAFSEDGDTVEGTPPGGRVVVLKFPDKAAAMEWYNSPEYQAVVKLRLEGTEGFALLCSGM